MAGTTVVICVDGLDPEYLDACETPNLTRLGGMGFLKTGQCMMPSVTNVNNVSLVTAAYSDTHGISSNYRLVRETGEEIYMESGEYVLAETMFQRLERRGGKSALVTSKDKLRTLLADGATIAVSSEQAPEWVVREVGAPPPIYSLEVNGWVVEAASFIMSRCEDLDVVYISTTDYAMHTYAPEEPESQRHLSILDEAVGELVESYPDVTLLLTADHGMSRKRRMVDLESALERYGMRAVAVPIIKDRYTVHHSNLGGCSYVYVDYVDPGSGDRRGPKTGDALVEALKVLGETPGVEEALSQEEAVDRFRLHRERIGDIVVTGEPDVVFGDPSETEMPPRLRSHASTHERQVPLLGYNGDFDGFSFQENRDLGRFVFERVLPPA